MLKNFSLSLLCVFISQREKKVIDISKKPCQDTFLFKILHNPYCNFYNILNREFFSNMLVFKVVF